MKYELLADGVVVRRFKLLASAAAGWRAWKMFWLKANLEIREIS